MQAKLQRELLRAAVLRAVKRALPDLRAASTQYALTALVAAYDALAAFEADTDG
jgi:hypothetical protein